MELTKEVVKTKWSMDQENSEIGFSVQHIMIGTIKGSFKTFDASIYTNSKDFSTAEINFWIDTSSITTNDVIRDKHLKSADLLDVKKYKQIIFNSITILKSDTVCNHDLLGELTMMGITQYIKLNVRLAGVLNDPWGNERVGFTVTGKINRKDWGLSWYKFTETGDLMVSDEVTIACEVELIKTGRNVLKTQM